MAVPPVPEQRLIAEVLDTLDAAIRRTEQVIAKLRLVKQGLLHDLLTRGLDDNGELRDPGRRPEQFRDSRLGRMPRAWRVASFESLCSSSAFGPRFSSDLYAEDGNLATLRTTDMDDEGNIDLTTMPWAHVPLGSVAHHLLVPDDLVISRSGTCGIAAVFPGFDRPVVPGAFLIRFRLHEPAAAHFYRRYFNSPLGRPRLDRLAVGGVQKNLKGSSVLALPVPLPPENEIRRIREVLECHERRIAREQEELAKLRTLKQGLADDLLTGRVRVPVTAEATP